MRIIGFDPSLKSTGYAVVDHPSMSIVSAGIIDTDPAMPFPERIEEIFANACRLMKEHKPDSAVFEESFYSKNVKSAIRLAQARAVLILAARQHKANVSLFAPNMIKKAVTGKGHASKQQVAFMINTIYDIDRDIPDDVSDALAAVYTFISRSCE